MTGYLSVVQSSNECFFLLDDEDMSRYFSVNLKSVSNTSLQNMVNVISSYSPSVIYVYAEWEKQMFLSVCRNKRIRKRRLLERKIKVVKPVIEDFLCTKSVSLRNAAYIFRVDRSSKIYTLKAIMDNYSNIELDVTRWKEYLVYAQRRSMSIKLRKLLRGCHLNTEDVIQLIKDIEKGKAVPDFERR